MRVPKLHEQRHVLAALDWLELGDPAEAEEELARIALDLQTHFIIVKTRWCVYAAAQKWKPALAIARALRRKRPSDFSCWILEAEALHELGRTRKAWAALLAAAELFPDVPVIGHLLDCYADQLGICGSAKHGPAKRRESIIERRRPKMKIKVKTSFTSAASGRPMEFCPKRPLLVSPFVLKCFGILPVFPNFIAIHCLV